MLYFGLLLFLSSLLSAAGPTTAVVDPRSSCVGSYQGIPTVFKPGPSARKLEDIESITVMEYNLKDFYIALPNDPRQLPQVFFGTESIRPKKLEQLRSIANTILSRSPDVLVAEEIVGPQTGSAFAKVFLKDKYAFVRIKPPSSSEAREIGFFIRKDLPFHVDLETHRDVHWLDPAKGQSAPLFPRDLPALLFRTSDQDPPFMVVIGNHGKAMRDRPGDPGSKALITAQTQGIVAVKDEYETQFPGIPIAVVGDFNRRLDFPEVIRAYGSLQDSFALPRVKVPKEQRMTHGAPGGEDGPKTGQINGTLVNKGFASRVESASVIAPVDSSGIPRSFPRTQQDLDKADSDHRPHAIRFKVKDLLAPFITRQ